MSFSHVNVSIPFLRTFNLSLLLNFAVEDILCIVLFASKQGDSDFTVELKDLAYQDDLSGTPTQPQDQDCLVKQMF